MRVVEQVKDVGITGVGHSAFGELSVAESTSQIAMQWPYNVNSRITETRANQSGSVDQNNGMLRLQTGTAANSSGTALSVEPVSYRPGQGIVVRCTGVFTTGVANSSQYIGIGDVGDGLFFGYDGATFGVMRRANGIPEIRVLTVATASSHDEDITITLDGDAKSDVAVTNTSDKTLTANEISAADYSDVGRGWSTHSMGDAVVFISWDASARAGTYTLSDSQSSAGTFARIVVGVAATETVIAQTAWNRDRADGTGVLPLLDPTAGNVYEIRFQWLGFGSLEFCIENPATGQFIVAHRIAYANANTIPSLRNPSLPLCMVATNTSNTSNITTHAGSMFGATEGRDFDTGITAAATGTNDAIATTDIPILTLHNRQVYQSQVNRTKVEITSVKVAVDATKSLTITARRNATLTGAVLADIDSNTSTMRADTTATALTGGVLIDQIAVQKQGTGVLRVGEILPGEFITFSGVGPSGTGHEAVISASWTEQF